MSRGSAVSLTAISPIGTRRVGTGWSAGFGDTLDPFRANLTNRSHRACRRALRRHLEMYADRLAISAEERDHFRAAAHAVASCPSSERWMLRIVAGHHDLTFWLLDQDEAELRGVRAKA